MQRVPVEGERFRAAREQERPAVLAGCWMKLVLDSGGGQRGVELAIARVEAVAVLLADIDIDSQILDFRGVDLR